jgi:hypothetical protein
MKLDITRGFAVDIESRLYNAGKNEFGQDYEAESYHVVVRRDDGRVWYHPMICLGAIIHLTEDGFSRFEDVRKEAKKEIAILLDKIVARGYIDTGLWYEGEPSYGSEYFRKVHRL